MEKWIERLFTDMDTTTTAENERYYYITQENVYTTFTIPKR